MKKLIYKIITYLFHPSLSKKGNTVLCSRFNNLKGNGLSIARTSVKKSEVIFMGSENSIDLDGCEVYSSKIFIRGRGHSLIIDEGVKLYNTYIKIIGKNNVVHIKSNSSFTSGNIVCGGWGTSILIGNDCIFADNLDIWNTDTHSVVQGETLVNPPASISIGNHVWVGKDVAILKGVTVGDDAVIGMKSLVTKDIRPSTLNVGSPAREIKQKVNWKIDNPNNTQ